MPQKTLVTSKVSTNKHTAKSAKTMDSMVRSHVKTGDSTVKGHHDSVNSYARVEPRKTEQFGEDNLVSVIPAPDEN